MRFNPHFHLAGKHAFLSASTYHWIRYDDDKLDERFLTAMAAQRGTDIHALAAEHIRLGIKMGRSRQTLNMYVNDCISWRMKPEVVLYYSDNCFCTADAIGFKHNLLRVSDLKTGVSKASMDQLKVNAAVFCLEYDHRPQDIDIELRIYQSDDIEYCEPEYDEIYHIMDRIITFDKRINALREELEA